MWPYHPELLERSVPRYTSYPTAVEFHDSVGCGQSIAALDDVAAGEPLSVYVHIPYCRRICWYCGCNTGAVNRSSRLDSYLEALEREIALVAAQLGGRGIVRRIALGGGSPNALSQLQFVRLLDCLTTRFGAGDVAISVEIDPRDLDAEWAALVGQAGIQAVSLGVQSFAPQVQSAIGRVQPLDHVARAIDVLRNNGVRSINFDLMYGLPLQRLDDLAETIEQSMAMHPDRLSVFGYAHLPEAQPRQRKIDAATLPDAPLRFRQAWTAHAMLVGAGYVPIGFDHFALPDDPLARAARSGQLRRNFQGFTDDICETVIGIGASAISRFPTLLAQNEKNSGRYRMIAGSSQWPTRRGIVRSVEDRRRGRMIEQLLCTGSTRLTPADARSASSDLAPFVAAGLARVNCGILSIQADGLPYARAIASTLDGFLRSSTGTFSNAV